jgi:aminopeptidase
MPNQYDQDPRWNNLAEILVNYSLKIKPGERLMIAMSEIESFPLARGIVEWTVKAGGFPQVQFLSEQLRHSFLEFGNDEQLAWLPEIEAYGMEWAEAYIALRGGFELAIHDGIDADRLAINQAVQGRVSTLRWQKTRWMLVRVPNEAFAKQSKSTLVEITEMFFAACLQNWSEEGKTLESWINQIKGSDKVQVLGEKTDLRFSIKGRNWIVADGAANMPDGEIATAPVTETIDGHIYFENPAVLGGRLVHDLFLRWELGKLVEATSSTNQDYLKKIIATDHGASLIGEFAMGTNFAVNRFTNDILIDEKIGGTIHIALGRAYPECGGTNESAIHWDIVKDIRKNGSVIIDGRTVLERGVFSFLENNNL